MIYFLFGKPGAGKSTLGHQVARGLKLPFLDGDQWYTGTDQKRIQDNAFTDQESDRFLISFIRVLKGCHQPESLRLIASQSLFRESQRQMLADAFPQTLRLIYLRVDNNVCLARLDGRGAGGGPERQAHFYGRQQFLQEIGGFETPREFDSKISLVIENNGPLEPTIQKLKEYILGKT